MVSAPPAPGRTAVVATASRRARRAACLLAMLLSPAAVRAQEPPPAVAPEAATPAPSGEPSEAARAYAAEHPETAKLFAETCAKCHGLDGSGTGPTVLDRPARDFKGGGFSFGNTPETLARTITSGIPGTPMPAWGESLTPGQVASLTGYVLALGPPLKAIDLSGAKLIVGDRAAVVRGILPPIVDGAPLRPRGLLVGLPGGLAFEFRSDDLRLLGVRFGEFVERTDWSGRGGTPLAPLGRLVLRGPGAGGADLLHWSLADSGAPVTSEGGVRARLAATRGGSASATVASDLEAADGRGLARVVATLTDRPGPRGLAWSEVLELAPADWRDGEDLVLVVSDPEGAGPLPAAPSALPSAWTLVARQTLGPDTTRLVAARALGDGVLSVEPLASGQALRLKRTFSPGLQLVTLLVAGSADAPDTSLGEVLR